MFQSPEPSVRLQLSLRMQQGLKILQAPLAELTSYVKQEITQNPVFDLSSLEEEEEEVHFSTFREVEAPPDSLFSYVWKQAKQHFFCAKELRVAQYIIGNLSDGGLFLQTSEEGAQQLDVSITCFTHVLNKIRTFHPIGVASPSLQAYWLLRLPKKCQAYQIIRDYYAHLITCDFARIGRSLHLSPAQIHKELRQALATIPWQPASDYPTPHIPSPLPDVYLRFRCDHWEAKMHTLPEIRLNPDVLNLYNHLPPEEKRCLGHQIRAAKELMFHLRKRDQTLLAIVEKLSQYQSAFLRGKASSPKALSIKELAQEIRFHESTLFRAIENKTLAVPIGLIPMKALFSKTHSQTRVSQEAISQRIMQMIAEENRPLSDATISANLKRQGICCARRTVAKYRAQLYILPAHQRRKY